MRGARPRRWPGRADGHDGAIGMHFGTPHAQPSLYLRQRRVEVTEMYGDDATVVTQGSVAAKLRDVGCPRREVVVHREVVVTDTLLEEQRVVSDTGHRGKSRLRQRPRVSAPEHPRAVRTGDVVENGRADIGVVVGGDHAHVVPAKVEPVAGLHLAKDRRAAVWVDPFLAGLDGLGRPNDVERLVATRPFAPRECGGGEVIG